ncbi:MAG: NTP transferase domain-containing protein [Anaerolineae bacterium]|nr:NTP transferase domain-containing protein [Anaerolineae bacterium]
MPESSIRQAVILAAGKGSRLMPFTAHCSKGMAPIMGKPIAARVADQFLPFGIHELILVIHPEDQQIRPYFEEYGRTHACQFTFVIQTEQKGMAHALLQAAPHLHSDFFLSACDNLVRLEVVPAMMEALTDGVSSVLLLKQVTRDQVSSTGIVEFDGERIIRIHEKPSPEEATSNISSLPMYLLRQEIREFLPLVQASNRGEYEVQDAMEMMLSHGDMRGVMTDWRLTLTNIDDLFQINLHYLETEQPAWLSPSARVHPSAVLIPPYFISDGVLIAENAHLGPCIYLGEGTHIGEGASLQHAVVLQQAHVPPRASISHQLYY